MTHQLSSVRFGIDRKKGNIPDYRIHLSSNLLIPQEDGGVALSPRLMNHIATKITRPVDNLYDNERGGFVWLTLPLDEHDKLKSLMTTLAKQLPQLTTPGKVLKPMVQLSQTQKNYYPHFDGAPFERIKKSFNYNLWVMLGYASGLARPKLVDLPLAFKAYQANPEQYPDIRQLLQDKVQPTFSNFVDAIKQASKRNEQFTLPSLENFSLLIQEPGPGILICNNSRVNGVAHQGYLHPLFREFKRVFYRVWGAIPPGTPLTQEPALLLVRPSSLIKDG
jgi:hypothetical protein